MPAACNIVKAFPDLGWVDGPTPGYKAAPMLALSFCSCAAATADWDTAAIKALLDLSELLVAPTLTFMQQCADGMDALGVYDKVYPVSDHGGVYRGSRAGGVGRRVLVPHRV